MGIFHDVCDALIDPVTGRALTGEALESAQNDPKWPRCRNRVSKRARFCNACGKPAPGGWWKCPSCKKWIGNDSRYCPHCNQPLYPEDRAAIAGGVWRKETELFAQRFEIGDIKRLLQNDLMVQEGTCAVIMDGGKVHGMLEAGRHNPDSLARKINWFGSPPPRSVVLIDIGEIAVPLHIEGLRTSEHFPIEFYGEVMLRFAGDVDAAKAFLVNILGENRSCTFRELTENFVRSVRVAVDEMCIVSTVDDLVRDPERRIRLHERMTSRLKEDLAACGLELTRVSSAEFTGEEYEEHAESLGKIDIERRRVERDAALRSLIDKEEMAKYKDATDLVNYKKMIDQEFRIDELDRDVELKVRQERAGREIEMLRQAWEEEDIRRSQNLQLEQKKHEIRLKELEDEAARLKTVSDAEAEAKAAKIWLEIRELKDKMAANRKAIDAARRKTMTLEELIADIDDPDKRKDLLDVFKMKTQSGMTEKQILATQGIVSDNDIFLQEMKDLYKEVADREERKLDKMLAPAIEAAKHAPAAPNIIK